MLEFQDKKKIRRIMHSRYMLAVLAVVIVFFTNAAYGMYKTYKETSANRATALMEKDNLSARVKELGASINALKTDRGMEEEIRKKYRVVKEGESVIIVVDDKENTASATKAVNDGPSFWDRFKNLFEN